MARPDGETSDGLEIISIGALYDGPWDKKYWSSSRVRFMPLFTVNPWLNMYEFDDGEFYIVLLLLVIDFSIYMLNCVIVTS